MKIALVFAILIMCLPAVVAAQEDPINSVVVSGVYYKLAETGHDYLLITIESPPKGSVLTLYVDAMFTKRKHIEAVKNMNPGDTISISGYLFNHVTQKGRAVTVVKVEALSIQ